MEAEKANVEKPKAKKKPSGRPFEKGHPGGPGRGNKREENYDDGDTIAAFRHVMANPPAVTDSPTVKRIRRMFLQDYKGFVSMYTALYRAETARMTAEASAKAESAALVGASKIEVAVGDQESRIEGLIGSLLGELV